MAFIIAIIASFLLGCGLVGWFLQSKWKTEVEEAKQVLADMSEQAHQITEDNKLLKQENADLKYQLGETKKDLEYLKSK